MNLVADLMQQAEGAGLRITLAHGRLRVTGTAAAMALMDESLRVALSRHRDELAHFLELAHRSAEPPFKALPIDQSLAPPLRPFWEEISRGEHDAGFTNCTNRVVSFNGPLEIASLRLAARDVIANHPVLGAEISGGGDCPKVRLPEPLNVNFVVDDLRRAGTRMKEHQLRERVWHLVWNPLRHQRHLHRIFVITEEPERHIVGLVLHHFVADRPSVALVFSELFQRYYHYLMRRPLRVTRPETAFLARLTDPRDPLNDPGFALARAFWRSEARALTGARLPAPDEPSGTHHKTIPMELDASIARGLRQVALENKVGVLSVILAVKLRAMNEVTGIGDPAVLLLDDGRLKPVRDEVGNFSRILMLRDCGDRNDCLVTVARRMHRKRLNVLRRANLPYQTIRDMLWNREPTPLLPLVNFTEDWAPLSPTRTAASGHAVISAFDFGQPPLLPVRAQEFESHYVQVHASAAGITGVFRFSQQRVAEPAANKFVRSFTDGLAAFSRSAIPIRD